MMPAVALSLLLLLGRPASQPPAKTAPSAAQKTLQVEKSAGEVQQQIASGSEKASSEELQQAQIDSAEAQTQFYRAQTEKTIHPSWWDRFIALSTLLAALVALLSFSLNYRVSLLNQQDAQFYEALKRFGDKDSPAVRACAAGLLSELGTRTRLVSAGQDRQSRETKLRFWRPSGWKRVRPFMQTSLDQLTAGLLLEENPVVLGAIVDAIEKLLDLDPNQHGLLDKLLDQNLDLQKEMAAALADFVASRIPGQNETLTDEVWQHAAAVCGYRPVVLETLAQRFDGDKTIRLGRKTFQDMLETARRRGPNAASASEVLRVAATRLRTNVGVWSAAFHMLRGTLYLDGIFLAEAKLGQSSIEKVHMQKAQLQDIESFFAKMPDASLYHGRFEGAEINSADLRGGALFGSSFKGASLYNVDLHGADLERSDFSGASLHECKLDGAKVYGVKVDEATELWKSNWWAADFSSNYWGVDKELLGQLYGRVLAAKNKNAVELVFGKEGVDSSNWLSKAHPTVRQYVEDEEKKGTPPASPS